MESPNATTLNTYTLLENKTKQNFYFNQCQVTIRPERRTETASVAFRGDLHLKDHRSILVVDKSGLLSSL